MLLKIKSDGTILYSFPENINQGSNLVNSVQVIAPFSKTLTADISFQLPQGTITEPLFMTPKEFSSDNTQNLWSTNIDDTITQYSGTVYFTIRFYTASENENPNILATTRSSFPVSKAVLPDLPLEPTTETYTNVLSHINDLYLTKVDRFDINDLPTGINYTAEGLKTSGALFTNATFTVSTTVYNGSLMVLANETTNEGITTRVQTEILYASDTILRRMLTIVDNVVTVGDWKDYSTEITEAISTHNISETAHQDIRTAIDNETIARENADTILQENIDAIETARVVSVNGRTGAVTLTKSDVGLGLVSNIKVSLNTVYKLNYISGDDYSIIVPNDITLQDITNYGIFTVTTTDMLPNSPPFNPVVVRVEIKNENNDIIISKRVVDFRYFNGNIVTAIKAPNSLRKGTLLRICSTSNGLQLYETNRYLSDMASVSMPGLLSSENLGKINNAILKTAQTLTSTEKSQVRTNIDVYSKSEVDNKVSSVYKFKGSVATYGDLPTENLTIGDVYNVLDTGKNFAWTGTNWDDLGGTVDLSNYLAKNNTTIFTPTNDYNPSTKKYVDDGLALKEPLLPTTPTDPESKFLNGNKVWTPIVVGGGSSAAAIYLTDDTSTTVGTYKQLSYALPSTETTVSAVVTAGTSPLLVQTYIYDTDYANTIIDAGKWTFNFTALLSTTAGTTHLRVEVFTRTNGGTETTLFTVDGADINSNTAVKYVIETLQSGFVVNTTDRLGLRVYAITTQAGNTTVTYYKGDGRGAYINTPLALRHSQLRDINGDSNYQHITQTEKTKLDNLNAPLIFNNITVLTTDFADNLTYSEFPYRASITLSGVLSTDSPKVYFSMADINTAVLTETIYQVVSYTGGVHIYATDLPTSDLTIDKIEIIR